MHDFAVVDPDLELRGGRGFACPDSFSSFQIFFVLPKIRGEPAARAPLAPTLDLH